MTAAPRAVMIYGLMGVLPFVAPPFFASAMPTIRPFAGLILALYGGLILSFLGGARWGLTVGRREPSVAIVSIAMLPTLAALALLALPEKYRGIQLLGLAGALLLHWLWDLSAKELPGWYPSLRTILTAGAVVGLLAGYVVLT